MSEWYPVESCKPDYQNEKNKEQIDHHPQKNFFPEYLRVKYGQAANIFLSLYSVYQLHISAHFQFAHQQSPPYTTNSFHYFFL